MVKRNLAQNKERRLPAAVIFDMDGVLLDSEPFICLAARMMFAEKGLTAKPSDFRPFVGAGENRYLGGVAEKYGFPLDIPSAKKRTYEVYLEIIKGRLKPLPGVPDFLNVCRRKGLKIGLASSADRIKVVGNLIEIRLPPESFDALVTGEDVERKKPAPEIFLKAARELREAPGHCLVVEDALNGVAAAGKAGARCLALTTSFSREELLKSGADWCAPNLALVQPEVLAWPS